MIGQGSPKTSLGEPAWLRIGVARWTVRVALMVCLASWLSAAAVAEETMRVRVAWGGGAERMWRTVVGVSKGTVSEPLALGIEADEPGSMWLDATPLEAQSPGDERNKAWSLPLSGSHLVARQRSPRAYDGVDLLVTAPLSAALLVQLTSDDNQKPPPWVSIPLADLVGNTYSSNLDDRGNRLMVRRAPGDDLRVNVASRSLVFSPGSLLKCTVEPHLLPVESGTKLRIRTQLLAARTSNVLWSTEHMATSGEQAVVPLEVRLDRGEGVFDLVFTAMHAGGLRWQNVTPALAQRQVLTERRIQVVVIGPEPPEPGQSGGEGARVVEIDPALPKWWERFSKLQQLPRLSRLWKGALGNGSIHTVSHPLGQLAQLRPGTNTRDVPWEAYPLPISRPGTPHILEIDYPSDVPQTMGISIIEPNAAGAVMPIGLDSGVDVADEIVTDKNRPTWRRHRLVFWPRTKTPMVLITNRRNKTPAVYGKIRVLAMGDSLPRAFPPRTPRPERLLAAYLDRPLLPETFSASDPAGSLSDLSVDDWVTFYEAGTRAVQYLNYVGKNGLFITVLADGSTIYPSRLVEPTPRHDSGIFMPTGQDPVRKDVLEMLFQLFDREGLQLIPALEFGAPLPELEAFRRTGLAESQGLCWIGPDGSAWTDHYQAMRGLAPYYNALHPRVQEAMLAVVRELVGTYAQHPSFAGLGLQLSAHGYAQLPGPDWGMDDATIARFQQDTRVRVPGEGPGRFAQRAAFLTGEARKAWLDWRAEQLSRFHRRIAMEVNAIRPHTRLYLAGAESLGGEEMERELQPSLSRRTTVAEALLRAGIDSRRYGEDRGIVLLRSERVVPHASLANRAVDLEVAQMPDVDQYYAGLAVPGSLFFHVPQELRLPSFDERSPFRPTYTWLVSHPVPSAQQNRRRFVHSLATLDSQVMCDGGWELALGEEDSLRELIAAYRQLPATRFDRVSEQPGSPTAQPVTVRHCTRDNFTYMYAVNDAPFSSVLRVRVDAPAGCQVEELSGLRRAAAIARDAQGAYWSVELAPYDLFAVRFNHPNVRLHSPETSWSSEVRTALETRISELGERAAALRNPPPLQILENPGFEAATSHAAQIPGWGIAAAPNTEVQLDSANPHGGSRSVRLASRGANASLVSRPFSAPSTGRLHIWLWLRTTAENSQPPLRLALEGKHRGRDFFRFALVGRAPSPGVPTPPIGAQWSRFVFQVTDLPLDGLSPLQVRFDLLGPGEVWVDDVQLSDLFFEKREMVELFRLIAPADVNLQGGQVGDCLRLLESYWAQFLVSNVTPPPVAVTHNTGGRSRRSTGDSSGESPRTGLLERMKGFLPDRMRF